MTYQQNRMNRMARDLRRKARYHEKQATQSPQKTFIASIIAAVVVILIATTWWPEVYGPFQVYGAPFWTTQGGLLDWLTPVWWLFAWGVGVNVLVQFILHRSWQYKWLLRQKEEPSAGAIFSTGTVKSLTAGVLEELAYRWLLYLSAIAMVVFGNWIWGTIFEVIILIILGVLLVVAIANKTQGDLLIPFLVGIACVLGIVVLILNGGFINPIKWLYEVLFQPVADWVTLGHLHPFLYSTAVPPTEDTWALGAGILAANGAFRDGHKYQGFFGYLNSWFVGMVLFWVLFTFGLVPAMVVHFVYDFLIFSTVAVMRMFR